jgi:hypothetical protein
MDKGQWKEKISGQLNKIREALLNLLSGLFPSKLFSLGLFHTIKNFLDNSLHRFPEEKRKPILFGLAGVFMLLLVLIIAAATVKPKKNAEANITMGFRIPIEDLFYPAEPDFLPEFLLGREPRRFWSLEDINQYWKVPGSPDWWRDEIKSAVDELLEGIP